MKTSSVSFVVAALAIILGGVASCNGSEPKTPVTPPPPEPKPAAPAPRPAPLCQGHELMQKLVAEGPLPPVDGLVKPGALVASRSGAKADPAFQKAYEKVAPTVVYIVTTRFTGEQILTASGTGTLIDDKGHIATNYHVVEDGRQGDFTIKVKVYFGTLDPSGRMIKEDKARDGVVVKVDPVRDMAIIRVDDLPKGVGHTKVSTKDPKVGEPVAAIGHANIGLLWAMKGCQVAGIGDKMDMQANAASCDDLVDPTLPKETQEKLRERCREHMKLKSDALKSGVGGKGLIVQTDCAVTRGDSGGPVINAEGEIVAMNRAVSSKETVDNGYHIHGSEIRQFVADIPATPAHDTPNPWCAGIVNEIEDIDLNGKIDLAKSLGIGEAAYFFDLDEDTFGADGSPKAGGMPFDAEVAFHDDAKNVFYVWYDTDNDGRFDLLLTDSKRRGTAEMGFLIDKDGGLKKMGGLAGSKLLDAKHLQVDSLKSRFGELSRMFDKLASRETMAAAEIVVPDPIWGGGRKGTTQDLDRDGQLDMVEVKSMVAKGLLYDVDQDSIPALNDKDALQQAINDRKLDVEMAYIISRGRDWAIYDTDGDGTHDVALLAPQQGLFTAAIAFEHVGGKWKRTTKHVGRALVRPGLINVPRFRNMLSNSLNFFAVNEGLGSVPNPKHNRLRFKLISRSELDKQVVSGDGRKGDSSLLLDVDKDSELTGGSISQLVRQGKFKADFARYVIGDFAWTYYDSDGNGDFDVVLFALASKPRVVSAYRLVGGKLQHDAKLEGSFVLNGNLFRDSAKAGAFKALAAKVFRGGS